MKNVGSPSANGGAGTRAFFIAHLSCELNRDFETLLFLGEIPRKSLHFPVNWVMKNAMFASPSFGWRRARFSSP
jgi:hypothetical protein